MSVSSELAGHVAVVTGAASGIGRASAARLASMGAHVVAVDHDDNGVARTASDFQRAGGAVCAEVVDVGDRSEVDCLVDRVAGTHGRIDALVHCAAVAGGAPLLELSDEQWRSVLRVNLDGSFWLGRAVGRVMASAGAGTMVFLSSDRGMFGAADAAAYAASKGGLIALVKSLALALAPSNVTVNAINPGTTDTPMARGGLSQDAWAERVATDPLGRVSRPEEIAEIVGFLCTSARDFMTGQIITTRMRSA